MTLIRENKEKLTADEWNELIALKKAINYNLASVHYERLEKFTEYYVKSLRERGA